MEIDTARHLVNRLMELTPSRKKSRRSFDLRQLEAYSLRGILALWPEPENILQFRLGLRSNDTEAL